MGTLPLCVISSLTPACEVRRFVFWRIAAMRPTLACCCAAGGGKGSSAEAFRRFCPTMLNFLIAIRGPRAGRAT
eukprot:scaffold32124_cov77-Phaeocystis_antarctica.AAC.10